MLFFNKLKNLVGGSHAPEPSAPPSPPPQRPSRPHILNIRPPDSNDAFAVYSPTRDLANSGGQLLQSAYACCVDGKIPDCVAELLASHNSTAEGAQVALACLAEAAVNAVRPDEEQLPIGVAVARSGFDSLSVATRVAALAHFGASCLAAIVHCTKDVTYEAGPTPHLDQIRKVVDESRIVARDAFNRNTAECKHSCDRCAGDGGNANADSVDSPA